MHRCRPQPQPPSPIPPPAAEWACPKCDAKWRAVDPQTVGVFPVVEPAGPDPPAWEGWMWRWERVND